MRSVEHSHDKGKIIPPERAESQRDFLLRVLRETGSAGISKIDFISGTGPCQGRRITQVSARIFELEAEGFSFEHRKPNDSDFTIFVLTGEPQPEAAQLRLGIGTSGHHASEFVQHEMGLDCARHSR
jgi:hypothetical protein